MEPSWITADLLIEDTMQGWPATLKPLLRRRMACVGCEAAPFHTLAEVAGIYDVPLDEFLDDLRQAAAEPVSDAATVARRYKPRRAG